VEPRRRLNPVCRPLSGPLMIWIFERRLFCMALTMGAAVFEMFNSLRAGALCTTGLLALAWLITREDPEMPRFILRARRMKSAYDAWDG
jgi:hypothetical protein